MDLDHDLVRQRCREITESLDRLDRIGQMSKEGTIQGGKPHAICSGRPFREISRLAPTG